VNKTGLLSNVATVIGVAIVPLPLAKCIPVYINSERMAWAGQEYYNNSAGFEKRCPELYKIFSSVINKRKRMTDAHATFTTGNVTDKQKLLLAPVHAGNKCLIDAHATFATGNVSYKQKLLLAP